MPYITKGNVSKIISHIDIKKLPNDFSDLKGDVYKKAINFFSIVEKNKLLLRKEFYRKPNSFLEVFKKIESKQDTYTYIYEGGIPSYHLSLDCPKLNSNFISYEIPLEIQHRGKDEVIRFRKFFNENKELLDRNVELFHVKMSAAFALKVLPKPVDYKNSGAEFIETDDLQELEEIINNLLLDFDNYYWSATPEKRAMISRYKTKTFLAFSPYEKNIIENNDTGFSDEEIREFLKYFAEKYKVPIIKYLRDFYRIFGSVMNVWTAKRRSEK